jgi:hypothetical protein
MANNKIDTNVLNYTVEELMAILEIKDPFNPTEIIERSDVLIDRFTTQDKPDMVTFFQNIKKRLLVNYRKNIDPSYVIPSDINEVLGRGKPSTEREEVEVGDIHEIPVKQDTLNPTLKNTITRLINLDSQFRQYTTGINSTSTEYTLDLSDTLKDVLSIRLFSYQIPYSWYVIADGRNCFCVEFADDGPVVPVTVPAGNYSPSAFVTALNKAFVDASFNFPTVNLPVTYESSSGKITMNLTDGSFNDVSEVIQVTSTTKIVFFDFDGLTKCGTNCYTKSNNYLNNTMGWIMGYRDPYIFVNTETGNKADAILDLNGPKYLILSLDDYNQNHVNNGLVSITELSSTLALPEYYNKSLPYTCSDATNNLAEILASDDSGNGLLIAGKYQSGYNPSQVVLPSAPRTLTRSQIYTINEILKNKNNNTNYLSKAPTTSDIMAIVPFKTSGTTGSLLVEFGSSLQTNIRTYFGPVNIERMSVRLLDDKGNLLDLNGGDWCFTLICECLYKY